MSMRTASLIAALCLLSATSQAATFVVTSAADSGAGTLRQAILDANAAAVAPHVIAFGLPADSTISVASDLPAITATHVSIDGAGSPGLIVDGGSSAALIQLAPANRQFELSDIELARGARMSAGGCLHAPAASGGASASIVLSRVVMRACEAYRSPSDEQVQGGALYVDRRHLTVEASLFDGNFAHSRDPALITRAEGGAIAFLASEATEAQIIGTDFIENRVIGSAVAGVGCCRAAGAAVWTIGPGTTALYQSRILRNVASTLDSSTTWGSAIFSAGTLSMDSSLVFANEGNGPLINVIPDVSAGRAAVFRNCIFVANKTRFGAMLDLLTARVELQNNTMLATESSSLPVPHLRVRTPFDGVPGTVYMTHNLMGPAVSALPSPSRPICDIADALTTWSGFNLIAGAAVNCGPIRDPDTTPLRIDALRDDGGEIETVRLLAGSAAVDGGDTLVSLVDLTRCFVVDARNFDRPRDGDANGQVRCDIGAWESAAEASLFHDPFEPVLWRPEG